MKKIMLLLFTLPFLATKCNDEPPIIADCSGNLNINVKPVFNNKPFVINSVYIINGKKVRFSKLQFYAYPTTDAKREPCYNNEGLFLNFTGLDDSVTASKGLVVKIKKQPGTYTTFGLGFGVDDDLNGKKPQDYSSDNPLSKSEEYWEGWKSYIFFKLEGLMDKDGDGTFETGVTYHTGSNEVKTSFISNQTYTVTDKAITLNFELNINALLNNFDFNVLNKIENLSQKDKMKDLMNNLAGALKSL